MPATVRDPQPQSTALTPHDEAASELLRRVGWHILPILLLLYFIAYLDRINIGFAATSMQRDLGFSDSLYGTGAGLFFIGYLVAQVPSNILLYRYGARRVIAVLMVVWGTIAGAMAFAHTPTAFLTLRFLLGIAEAGFYPGVILYLALWLPRRVRTSFTAWFIFAIPLASIFGGPVSTWILQRGGTARFADWQLLLLFEAAPAIVVGVLLPWLMTDSPLQASWMSDSDRALLQQIREADEPSQQAPNTNKLLNLNPQTITHIARFGFVYFAVQIMQYTLSFFLPKILHSLQVPTSRIGWYVAIVYIIAGLGMMVWAFTSDRTPTSRFILSVPLLVAAIGFAATAAPATQNSTGSIGTILVLAAFGVAAAGAFSCTPPFWSLATVGRSSSEMPALIAVINSVGNLGGFAGPALIGRLQQSTGSHVAGMLFACGASLLGAVALYTARARTTD